MIQEFKVPFLSGLAKVQSMHGLEITEPEYLELAFSAWDKINTKAMRMYQYTATITDNKLTLPCNLYYIEAVMVEDYVAFPVNRHNIDVFNIERFFKYYDKPFSADLYNIRGQFVRYEVRNNTLYFMEEDMNRLRSKTINLYYKGIVTDDDGYPMLTDKQAEAISYYVVYIMQHRRMMQGLGDANLVGYLKNEWLEACSRARVPEHMSQNAFDTILNANSNWDRKRWNRAYSV